jgi:hypothetical protein
MHDPFTTAFDIYWPIPKKLSLPNGKVFKDYSILITIWHVDPENDGSDDSCGWSRPNLSDEDKAIIDDILRWEKDSPYFSSQSLPNTAVIVDAKYDFLQQTAGDCLGHVAAAWQMIAWHKNGRKKLSAGEWWNVVNLATNPADNLRAILADPEEEPRDRARRFLYCVMRDYLRYHRPWYRHPRWHIHHWQIQISSLQRLNRWLFGRCQVCGKRFAFGETPVSIGWNEDGRKIFHQRCLTNENQPQSPAESPANTA